MSNPTQLALEGLFSDLPGITKPLAGSCYEAILICLEHHNHQSGVKCDLNNLDEKIYTLEITWTGQTSEQTRRAWGEPRNAVEDGAVGVAYLTVPQFTEYSVIERANIGNGLDYWLGYKEDVARSQFLPKARLEVSGILEQRYSSAIQQRVKEKLEQTKRSDNTELPAYVVVAEFSRPVIYLVLR